MNSKRFKILRTISCYVFIFLFVTRLIANASTIQPTSDAVVSDTLVDYKLNSEANTTSSVPVPLESNSLSYAVNTRIEENPYNNYEDKLKLHSSSSILIDMDVNRILYEKNAYQKMFPASTTKTLTAILTVEKCDLNAQVAVSHWAVNSVGNNYSKAKLAPGELITVNDLLKTMMIESANDSAYVLGQYIANNCTNTYPIDSSDTSKTYFNDSIATFSTMMNEKAKSLGCINSDFKNPNGMHVDTHYSCAYDLALIGQYAYSNNIIKDIVKEKSGTLPNTDKYTGAPRNYTTTNLLFSNGKPTYYEYATGLKTGYTSAGKSCMIATAEKDNRHLLKQLIVKFIKELQNRYIGFIVMVFVILLFSFYYLVCFNRVYPKTQLEWLKSSIVIMIFINILSLLKCLYEASLRVLSFRFQSEKLFKLSKIID